MFKNDFLMQRIAELASGVARVLGLKHSQEQAQEDGALDGDSLRELGLPLDLLVQLSPRDLRLRCSSMGEIDAFRAATAGALLAASTRRYPDRARSLHARSLDLVLLAMEENPELNIEALRALAAGSVQALGTAIPSQLRERASDLALLPR